MGTVDKIRILVGLNVNKYTVKIIDTIQDEVPIASISANEGKEIMAEEIEKEFEQADTTMEIEQGIRVL